MTAVFTGGGISTLTEAELYIRGAETLLASWEQYARGAVGAKLQRLGGVAAAVFPDGPERDVYNNRVRVSRRRTVRRMGA